MSNSNEITVTLDETVVSSGTNTRDIRFAFNPILGTLIEQTEDFAQLLAASNYSDLFGRAVFDRCMGLELRHVNREEIRTSVVDFMLNQPKYSNSVLISKDTKSIRMFLQAYNKRAGSVVLPGEEEIPIREFSELMVKFHHVKDVVNASLANDYKFFHTMKNSCDYIFLDLSWESDELARDEIKKRIFFKMFPMPQENHPVSWADCKLKAIICIA